MGERLGRYSVLKHLASGGMADVLLGRTEGIEGFERHVVLKQIKAEHAKDQRFIQMFLDEARTAANLHHQNIVQVYDIGEANDGYFFAMEYIHGEDLRKLLSAVSKSKKHMPLGYVCGILSAAAAGLHYAHERRDNRQRPLNIVHRDVSPSNILIGYDGAVKVVDFGIAKAATRAVETRSGSLKGKVSYMSPEQCKGEDIDRRSDVWALGVLLYELSTTTRLFKGDNDYLVMDAIVNGKVPLPRVRRPDLPNELSSIIMRALSTDRNRRFQDADELRIALDQFAIKNNLTASTSALATYMRKMFGERPEPWLELEAAGGQAPIDVDAPTQAAGQSWTEMPREVIAATDEEEAALAEEAKTTTGGKRSRRSIITPAAVADTIAPPISTRETRTSMKLGWEAHGKAFVDKHGKRLWVVAPLLVIAGLGIWKLTSHDDGAAPKAAAAAPAPVAQPVTPAPAPTVTPIATAEPTPPPERDIPAIRVAGPEEPADDTGDAEKKSDAKDRIAAKIDRINQKLDKLTGKPGKPDKLDKTAKTDKVVTTAQTKAGSPAPTTAAAPSPAPTPPPAPTPTPVVVTPPAAPTPTPAPAPAPAQEIEATIPSLSNATVSAIASDHARQLAQCEGSSTLHGDVAVTFQIDGTGKVVKSQLSSSIKNPKVATCILKAVQSWKFPKPPSGSAKGVYSISYQ